MSTRICHVSDTHGQFPLMYGDYSAVVHSGDFFPDPPGRPKFTDQIGLWQLDWLEENMAAMQAWLYGKPFLFTLGNHDWAQPKDMIKLLNNYGVPAFCLHDRVTNYGDIHFYGFPYVPTINGMFNYERDIPEMQKEVKKMVDTINTTDYVDVLVCHAPIHNILDFYDNRHLGSSVIANALDYQIKSDKLPSYYLHGHIHNNNGIAIKDGILISNAARSKHIIEIL